MPDDLTPTPPAPAAPPSPNPVLPPLDWREAIPADLKDEPFFAETLKDKSAAEAWRVSYDQHKEVGRRLPPEKAFQIPDDRSSPEWARVFDAIRPEAPKDYSFVASPELELDTAKMDALKQHFWDRKFSDTQATEHIAYLAANLQAEKEAEATALRIQADADERELRETFGAQYDEKLEQAARIFKEFGVEAYVKEIGIEKDPKLAPIFAALGALTAEGRLHTVNGGQRIAPGETIQAIQGQLDAIRNSKEYLEGYNPDLGKQIHELTVKREALKDRQKQMAAGFHG